MSKRFTIGQLAQALGIATSTVRYYERINLVRPEARSGSNYRLYGREALERLKFIRAAQAIGFTLDDIALLLSHRNDSESCCRKVQGLIEERLDDLKQRMEDLRRVHRELRIALRKCRRTEQAGHCQVIDKLNAVSSSR
jgi:DNA-binding transcriptional MerR regulator